MKIALFSDIHSNLQAFEACLTHAKDQNISQFAILGDIVGYGANPKEVLKIVMDLKSAGAFVIKGNHDAMVVDTKLAAEYENNNITESALWTHNQLSEIEINFLANLELSIKWDNNLLVHASAHEPLEWRYIDNENKAESCLREAQIDKTISHVFVGHVHHQVLYYKGSGKRMMPFIPTPGIAIPVPKYRQWVTCIGSVGQPRDNDPRAMYIIYDQELEQITYHRVSYDFSSAVLAIRNAKLPEIYAKRLELGE
jgi:predicted phosphodiesterase